MPLGENQQADQTGTTCDKKDEFQKKNQLEVEVKIKKYIIFKSSFYNFFCR